VHRRCNRGGSGNRDRDRLVLQTSGGISARSAGHQRSVQEPEPSLSPEGSRVAYPWNGENQNNFDIYVKLIGPVPRCA
jgi:hypothetical protein